MPLRFTLVSRARMLRGTITNRVTRKIVTWSSRAHIGQAGGWLASASYSEAISFNGVLSVESSIAEVVEIARILHL